MGKPKKRIVSLRSYLPKSEWAFTDDYGIRHDNPSLEELQGEYMTANDGTPIVYNLNEVTVTPTKQLQLKLISNGWNLNRIANMSNDAIDKEANLKKEMHQAVAERNGIGRLIAFMTPALANPAAFAAIMAGGMAVDETSSAAWNHYHPNDKVNSWGQMMSKATNTQNPIGLFAWEFTNPAYLVPSVYGVGKAFKPKLTSKPLFYSSQITKPSSYGINLLDVLNLRLHNLIDVEHPTLHDALETAFPTHKNAHVVVGFNKGRFLTSVGPDGKPVKVDLLQQAALEQVLGKNLERTRNMQGMGGVGLIISGENNLGAFNVGSLDTDLFHHEFEHSLHNITEQEAKQLIPEFNYLVENRLNNRYNSAVEFANEASVNGGLVKSILGKTNTYDEVTPQELDRATQYIENFSTNPDLLYFARRFKSDLNRWAKFISDHSLITTGAVAVPTVTMQNGQQKTNR